MASYFNESNSEIHPDGLQTLYLMNPSYFGYVDAAATPANMVLLNQSMSSVHPMLFGDQPNIQQHFVGIPIQPVPPPQPIEAVHQGGAAAGGLQSFPMRSKYLKAVQELLKELVSVGKEITGEATKGKNSKSPIGDSEGTKPEDRRKGSAAEFNTSERQELQIKKGKLDNMLDEVELKYNQYHNQMQIVVSSFEVVAGYGSSRTYTTLAIGTISKQFGCLRDAIACQIRATSKILGDQDAKNSSSRLRFVDHHHHLRQKRALQQLGMAQHNAWRPRRGLPDRAVSILRAWLFEHFLHPYPKDSDKLMLAKQSGLTRSQVSNWFINARVRLWKPMVEEMCVEEVKDQEEENASKSDANESSMDGRHVIEDQDYPPLILSSTSHVGHYGIYPSGELERSTAAEQFTPRFSAGGSVSLTLGLPHSGAQQQSFLSGHPDFVT